MCSKDVGNDMYVLITGAVGLFSVEAEGEDEALRAYVSSCGVVAQGPRKGTLEPNSLKRVQVTTYSATLYCSDY